MTPMSHWSTVSKVRVRISSLGATSILDLLLVKSERSSSPVSRRMNPRTISTSLLIRLSLNSLIIMRSLKQSTFCLRLRDLKLWQTLRLRTISRECACTCLRAPPTQLTPKKWCNHTRQPSISTESTRDTQMLSESLRRWTTWSWLASSWKNAKTRWRSSRWPLC